MDDDSAILTLLGITLREAGYEVLLADGGHRAVQIFDENPGAIHLLVTDVVMPDLSGPALAQRLRGAQPELPVLFISGHYDATLVQSFIARKGFTFLHKPFTAKALLQGVEDALRLSLARRRVRTSGSGN